MPNLPEFFQGLPFLLLILAFAFGVAGLTLGGNWLCRGAVSLATVLKIRPIIIGLTVVSAATSMPEFFTSVLGALTGSPGLAIGNIIGSNIANIGLILGISALLCPLVIRVRLIRIDVPIMIAVSFLFVVLCWTSLSRFDGLLLLTVLSGYLLFLVRETQRDPMTAQEIEEELGETITRSSLPVSAVWVVLGTVALAAGAELLVRSSVEMAGRLGVNEVLIGLTVVAIGTSLPELATSIVAAARKHADLCAGNLVGSNLMNLILVSGLVATITPLPVERQLFQVEFPFMLFFAVLLWPLFFTGRILSRNEGIVLLLFYLIFLGVTSVLRLGLTFW
jgi:cation:H+ antiporter